MKRSVVPERNVTRAGARDRAPAPQKSNTVPWVADPLAAAAILAATEKSSVSDRSGSLLRSPDEYTRFERARILGARALQVSLGPRS